MLETIRKYWIGMLVLVMIGLHASIVGLIRYQASQAKIDISCEVDLGRFLAYPKNENTPISMRLHAIVPPNHRMKSRQLIELNQAQIRQAIEEHIRQIDHRVMSDPYLSDLRTQLLDVMMQTIGKSSIEDLTITEVQRAYGEQSLAFVSRGDAPKSRQLVATLRTSSEEEPEETSKSHDESTHSEEQGAGEDETGKSHDEKSTATHGSPKALKTTGKHSSDSISKKHEKKSGH